MTVEITGYRLKGADTNLVFSLDSDGYLLIEDPDTGNGVTVYKEELDELPRIVKLALDLAKETKDE